MTLHSHIVFIMEMLDNVLGNLIEYWPFWVAMAVAAAIFLLLRMYSSPTQLPYFKRPSLLTKSELRFYRSLHKAVLDDFEVFAMVRIADLIRVEKGSKNGRKWLNKILSKHIDFVLCDPRSLEPVACIELDDASHQRPDRIERDRFVNDAFDSADLPLLRIAVQESYNAREVRDLIEEAI